MWVTDGGGPSPNLRGGSVAAPATAVGPEAERLDALARLGGLRDSGVLSAEEFEAEKKRVLTS